MPDYTPEQIQDLYRRAGRDPSGKRRIQPVGSVDSPRPMTPVGGDRRGVLEKFGGEIQRGLAQGGQAYAMTAEELAGVDTSNQIAALERTKQSIPITPEMRAFQENSQTVGDFARYAVRNPLQTAEWAVQQGLGSAAAYVPIIVPAAKAGSLAGAAIGGAIGAPTVAGEVATIPAGATIGGVAGGIVGTGLGSAALQYSQGVLEKLQAAGIQTTNPVQLKAALNNPTLMRSIRAPKLKEAAVVGAFDAASMGLAGRIPVSKAITNPLAHTLTKGVSEVGAQAFAGGAGSAFGSMAAGEPVNVSDVIGEAVGEVGPGFIEIAQNVRADKRRMQQAKIEADPDVVNNDTGASSREEQEEADAEDQAAWDAQIQAEQDALNGIQPEPQVQQSVAQPVINPIVPPDVESEEVNRLRNAIPFDEQPPEVQQQIIAEQQLSMGMTQDPNAPRPIELPVQGGEQPAAPEESATGQEPAVAFESPMNAPSTQKYADMQKRRDEIKEKQTKAAKAKPKETTPFIPYKNVQFQQENQKQPDQPRVETATKPLATAVSAPTERATPPRPAVAQTWQPVSFKRVNPALVAQPLIISGKDVEFVRNEFGRKGDGEKRKGKSISIPGFEEYDLVLVKPQGNKAKHNKEGWKVYEKNSGAQISHMNEGQSAQSAMESARKRMANFTKIKLDESIASVIKSKQPTPAPTAPEPVAPTGPAAQNGEENQLPEGVTYNGEQERVDNPIPLKLYTDAQTKTTFAVDPTDASQTVQSQLEKTRAKFETPEQLKEIESSEKLAGKQTVTDEDVKQAFGGKVPVKRTSSGWRVTIPNGYVDVNLGTFVRDKKGNRVRGKAIATVFENGRKMGEISISEKDMDSTTLPHEVFHVARRLALTEQEYAAAVEKYGHRGVLRELQKYKKIDENRRYAHPFARLMKKISGMAEARGITEEAAIAELTATERKILFDAYGEEGVADAFSEYTAEDKALWDKIWEWIYSLYEKMHGREVADRVFERIANGEVWLRGMKKADIRIRQLSPVIAGRFGALTPNEAYKNQEGQNGVTPEQDAAYIKAMENKDFEAAQKILESSMPPLPKMSKGLKIEVDAELDISIESEEITSAWNILKMMITDADDKEMIAFDYRAELRNIGKSMGIYSQNTKRDIDETVSTFRKKYDFKENGIYYVFDSWDKWPNSGGSTYDDAGNVIPLSQRFGTLTPNEAYKNQEGQNGVTPEQDAAYMDAVKRGDVATAQKMVDAAAKAGGYLYHRYSRSKDGFSDVPWMMFSAKEDDVARSYGKYKFVAKENKSSVNSIDIEEDIYDALEETEFSGVKKEEISPKRIVETAGIWDSQDAVQIIWDKVLEPKGILSVVTPDGFIAMDQSTVKSADPVTYDDEGNVIPLSQRFNPASEDSRHKEIDEQYQEIGVHSDPSKSGSPPKESWAEVWKKAKDQKIADRAITVAIEVLDKVRKLSRIETAGLTIRKMQLQNQEQSITNQLEKMEAGTDEALGLVAELDRIVEEYGKIYEALVINGTEDARNLNFRKAAINRDYSPLVMLHRQISNMKKGGKNPTKKQIDKMYAEMKELSAKEKAASEKVERMLRENQEKAAWSALTEQKMKAGDIDVNAAIQEALEMLRNGCTP